MASGPDEKKDARGIAAMKAQRDKVLLTFKEEMAPGLSIEMELKNILTSTESQYQQVDVIETYFGKVRKKLQRILWAGAAVVDFSPLFTHAPRL